MDSLVTSCCCKCAQWLKKGEIGDVRLVELQYTHGFNATDAGDKFNDAQKNGA
ncbi:hypothetical protein GCM10020331_085120 [Ectobacillus funiculus]